MLTRYYGKELPGKKNPPGKPVVSADGKTLRVLVAASNPAPRLPPPSRPPKAGELVDLGVSIEQVKNHLDALKDQIKESDLHVTYDQIEEDQLSFETFKTQLSGKLASQSSGPHVVHVIGHGRYEQDAHGSIAFVSRSGNVSRISEPEWISDDTFARIFSESQCLPRVIFLHLCEGGQGTTQGRIAGIASSLSALGIPAVVAMQYPISQDIARIFSENFYKAIGMGATADEAVQVGRTAIAEKTVRREFGIPIVYISTHDVLLLQKSTSREPQHLESSIGDPIAQRDIIALLEPIKNQPLLEELVRLLTKHKQHIGKPKDALSSQIFDFEMQFYTNHIVEEPEPEPLTRARKALEQVRRMMR